MKFLDHTGLTQFWQKIKAYIDAVANRVLLLETTDPQYKLVKWGKSELNITIPPVSENVNNTALPKFVYTVPDDLKEKYKVTGLMAYEVFDANTGGNRLNYIIVCQFTGQNSTELSVRGMVAGTQSKIAQRISAYILLEKR